MTNADDLDRTSVGFDLVLGIVLLLVLSLCFILAVLVPVDNSDVLRHRCDDRGGIFRAASSP